MRRLTAQQVIAAVAMDAGLRADDLKTDARYRRVARPRQIAMFLMRRLCPHLSMPAIGRILGGRDHTTILHGVRQIYALMPNDPDLEAQVERIEARLRAMVSAQAPVAFGEPVTTPFDALCAGYAASMGRLAT